MWCVCVCVCKCTYMHTQGTQEEVREFFRELIFSYSTFFEARSLLLLLLLLCILYASLQEASQWFSWLFLPSHYSMIDITDACHCIEYLLDFRDHSQVLRVMRQVFLSSESFPQSPYHILPDNIASSSNKNSLICLFNLLFVLISIHF